MKMIVLYDGQCPLCLREVEVWKQKPFAVEVLWKDITGQHQWLSEHKISYEAALLDLHVIAGHRVYKGIPAYAQLLQQLPGWRTTGILISIPVIRHLLGWFYRASTVIRLKRQGRYPFCAEGHCPPTEKK